MPADQSDWLNIDMKADRALELLAEHALELLPSLLILPELVSPLTIKRHQRGTLIAFQTILRSISTLGSCPTSI